MLDQWSDKMKTAGQVARNTRNGPEEIQEGPIKLSGGYIRQVRISVTIIPLAPIRVRLSMI
jgi:hypothetical protein